MEQSAKHDCRRLAIAARNCTTGWRSIGHCTGPNLLLPSMGVGEHFAALYTAIARSLPRFGAGPQTTVVAEAGDQWVKRDSVSAVPNLRLSSSLHSSRDVWLANFSFM